MKNAETPPESKFPEDGPCLLSCVQDLKAHALQFLRRIRGPFWISEFGKCCRCKSEQIVPSNPHMIRGYSARSDSVECKSDVGVPGIPRVVM
jgi:hypothetical protein